MTSPPPETKNCQHISNVITHVTDSKRKGASPEVTQLPGMCVNVCACMRVNECVHVCVRVWCECVCICVCTRMV